MKFAYPRNASQSSTPTPIALLASSSSSQTPISRLIHTLRNIRCSDIIEETSSDTQDELFFCSICYSCSCLSPCWVPWCETYCGPDPAANLPTSNRGIDREMGERSKSGGESEKIMGAEAINSFADAEFWVPDWARLGATAAASDEQKEKQRAAGTQIVGATGMMRNESGKTLRIISTATESGDDPLLVLWGPALTRATPEIQTRKVQPGTLPPGTKPYSADITFFGAYGLPSPSIATATPTSCSSAASGRRLSTALTSTDSPPSHQRSHRD